jgi:hypothetical protein
MNNKRKMKKKKKRILKTLFITLKNKDIQHNKLVKSVIITYIIENIQLI